MRALLPTSGGQGLGFRWVRNGVCGFRGLKDWKRRWETTLQLGIILYRDYDEDPGR